MSHDVAALTPRSVWGHFADILQIPRPSKHEEKMLEHVRAVAKKHGVNVTDFRKLVAQYADTPEPEGGGRPVARVGVEILQASLHVEPCSPRGPSQSLAADGVHRAVRPDRISDPPLAVRVRPGHIKRAIRCHRAQ